MRYILLIVLLALTACANQTKLAKVPESDWTELKCSGILSWHDCKQEAKAVCPNGYYVADQLENITIQRREVLIACKA